MPHTIGNLANLEQLILNYNKIKEIPDSLGNLTKITKIYLDNNKIEYINRELYQWFLEKKFRLHNNIGIDYGFVKPVDYRDDEFLGTLD